MDNRVIRRPGSSDRMRGRRERRTGYRPAMPMPLESRQLLSVGGGFTGGGLQGEYFNDTSLSGTPSFTRDDVRIDFNWGTTGTPGGSNDPGFSAIGSANYSARWTGQVIPNFSETYTFKTTSDDGARLFIRPTGSGAWTTLINDWTPHSPTVDTAPYRMVAGQSYDIELDYFQAGGGAQIKLEWMGPSTPEEDIEAVAQVGINNPDWTAAYTDLVKGARNSWLGTGGVPAVMDAYGWPMGDGEYVFQESLNQGLGVDPLMLGTVAFSFHGSADVSLFGNVDYSSLKSSYNPATNTTTGSFVVQDNNSNASSFRFSDSHRDGKPTGPGGITDLELMRPSSPGASTSYAPGTVFTPQIVDAMDHYTVIRYQEVGDQEMNWSDRTLPGYFNQDGGNVTAPRMGNGIASDDGASWEYKIMLANESGRDLMISIPPLATGGSPTDYNSYIYKLAELIKYGSDGVNPYSSPQAHPAYPPLNSNLHVYFEIGNELWNWSGPFYTDFANINSLAAADATANNADFQAINYDHLSTARDANGNYVSMPAWRDREIMLRLVQMSGIFRSVFGNAAMMTTIRPLYEWQYANANGSAQQALTFADQYFNDADGVQHVAAPHPVNYSIWGGGGATYYGAANPDGLTNLIADSSFDATALASGYNQAPKVAAWTFTGTAGIARDGGTPGDIPQALGGSQMGYITDKGSISINVTFPTGQVSDVYALSFKAVDRTKAGASAADAEDIRIYLDGVDITARTYSQGNGYTPPGYDPNNPWMARNVAWTLSDYYATRTFTVAPGSTHTITIKGMGDIGNPALTNQTAFLQGVQVTSVDAIFAGGMPGGGEAAGQPVGQNYQSTLDVEVDWAKAYGLQTVAYEGGWSLGGDDGGSPLQLAAKYGDGRTAGVQEHALDMFYQAGGALSVLGTYAQWQNWSDDTAEQGLLDVDMSPLVQGVDDRLDHLTAAPTNGIAVPAVLKPFEITLSNNADTTGAIGTAGGWVDWNVLVPRTGIYVIGLTTSGAGGKAVLLADDAAVASGAGGGILYGTAWLTAGLHTIEVRSASATAFTVTQVTMTVPGAPPVPTPVSAVGADGAATLTWSPVAGASGYIVNWGMVPGSYTTGSALVGTATSYTVTGLTDGTAYYFVVSARNASGQSLPSNALGAIPLAAGGTGTLADWEFNGAAGNEPTSAPSATAGQVTVGALSRGPGLVPSTDSWAASFRANRFASSATTTVYGADLAGAIAQGQYYQFTIAPAAGSSLSLGSLNFLALFQNSKGAAGITYSTDGLHFSAGIAASGSSTSQATPWTVDLSGHGDLQGTTAEVTIRIYLYGLGAYEVSGLGDPSGTGLVVSGTTRRLPSAGPAMPAVGGARALASAPPIGAVGSPLIAAGASGTSPAVRLGGNPIALARPQQAPGATGGLK